MHVGDFPAPGLRTRALMIPHGAAVLVVCLAGCAAPAPAPNHKTTSLDADCILARCVERYETMRTLRATGTLRDFRGPRPTIRPIRWEFVRPDRMRFEIARDVAVVIGSQWWTYDDAAERFRRHRQFTTTPFRTPSYLLTRGVPFLIPALMEDGEQAFEGSSSRGFRRWALRGVDWREDTPCFVLERRRPPGLPDGTMRVWIEQDRFLVRAWVLLSERPDGKLSAVIECDYDEVVVDAPVLASAFQLSRPTDPGDRRPTAVAGTQDEAQ